MRRKINATPDADMTDSDIEVLRAEVKNLQEKRDKKIDEWAKEVFKYGIADAEQCEPEFLTE